MIEINNLSKSYGINKIFENESITLTNSCIYALVGVNGIGKSTFLNSIIQPSTLDKGSVKIDDIPSTDFTAKYHYAFVPDTKDMFLNLTGKEYLQFVSELYNQKEKFDELLAIYIPKLKLENSLEQTISSYSLGMKQKIYLAGAFMSNAQNIILDEPFNAIDPESTSVIKKILFDLKDTGKMIFAPLGFGEIGVKERIKKIMVYKKTKLSVVILAIVICGIIVICFGTRKKVSDASKNSAGQEKTVAKEKDSTKQDEIIGQKPVVDVNTSPGADGTQLYYGDENKIIFGGYYGLFVYDTENQKYIQSVDLKPIGCNMTQGDGAVEIMVKKGGEVVYLHKMSDKENMYEYSVENNTFVKKKYNLDKKALYHGATTDNGYVEARFKTKKGKVNSYIFVNDYLNLSELAYRRIGQDIEEKDDLVFPLFIEEHLRSASYFTSSDVYNIVRAEIEYDGKHYVCKNKKVLADIEKGYANAQKGKGLSACPFTYVMYLTRKDGVIGMVIPAMDSCKACVMGDGWYEQDNSLSMSIYDMIEKGWFKAE